MRCQKHALPNFLFIYLLEFFLFSFYLEWDANFFAATASWGLSVCDTWQLERELTNSLKPATIDLKNKSMGPYDIVRFSENLKKFENKW